MNRQTLNSVNHQFEIVVLTNWTLNHLDLDLDIYSAALCCITQRSGKLVRKGVSWK